MADVAILEQPAVLARPAFIERGTGAFVRTCFALICSGFSAFAVLYCLQPILPSLAADFAVSPAESSFALSISTLTLAIGLVFTGPMSDAYGRKPMMVGSMVLAGALTIAAALIPNWTALLISRALLGLVLGGITAINMTFLAEEVHPRHIGYAMGLMIGGNSLGGMLSRVIVGIAADYLPWNVAVAALGGLAIIGAVVVARVLPSSKHFEARPLRLASAISGFKLHLANPLLIRLFLLGFLLMGSFVAFFNYIGFHLMQAPLDVSQSAVGMISLVFIFSTYASTKVGGLADRFGSGPMLQVSIATALIGLALAASSSLLLAVFGVAVFTCGFFGAHSVVSGWIGRSTKKARAQATSLYQIFFYVGASVAGSMGGVFWQLYEWSGVCMMIAVMLLAALTLAIGAASSGSRNHQIGDIAGV